MQGISLLSILGQGTVTFLYTHSQDQKVHLFVLMVNFSGKELVIEVHMPQVFSYLQCLSYSLTIWTIL